jgi:hypothetical protein
MGFKNFSLHISLLAGKRNVGEYMAWFLKKNPFVLVRNFFSIKISSYSDRDHDRLSAQKNMHWDSKTHEQTPVKSSPPPKLLGSKNHRLGTHAIAKTSIHVDAGVSRSIESVPYVLLTSRLNPPKAAEQN